MPPSRGKCCLTQPLQLPHQCPQVGQWYRARDPTPPTTPPTEPSSTLPPEAASQAAGRAAGHGSPCTGPPHQRPEASGPVRVRLVHSSPPVVLLGLVL